MQDPSHSSSAAYKTSEQYRENYRRLFNKKTTMESANETTDMQVEQLTPNGSLDGKILPKQPK